MDVQKTILMEKVETLEKELAELKKDYGRLCQNDSVMRTESSVAFKRLDKQDEEIKELKLFITNLHQECQRLYTQGFSNGVETAKKEISDNIKRLEDLGLISYHGFLKSESDTALDKLALDESCKSLKEKTEFRTCYHKTCAGCKDLHLDSETLINTTCINGSLKRYTCKMKGITILANITPRPENFVEAFKKE